MLRDTHRHELTSFIFHIQPLPAEGLQAFYYFAEICTFPGKMNTFLFTCLYIIYIYTDILGTFDLALPIPGQKHERALAL